MDLAPYFTSIWLGSVIFVALIEFLTLFYTLKLIWLAFPCWFVSLERNWLFFNKLETFYLWWLVHFDLVINSFESILIFKARFYQDLMIICYSWTLFIPWLCIYTWVHPVQMTFVWLLAFWPFDILVFCGSDCFHILIWLFYMTVPRARDWLLVKWTWLSTIRVAGFLQPCY